MDKLRIFNVLWTSHSGGVSPLNNARTEIFLAGCKMAMNGAPCKDCFNPALWDGEKFVAEVTPEEAFQQIEKFAPNKFITFVGGEPLDQIGPLSRLCALLKADGYHIIVFTHHTMLKVLAMERGKSLLNNIHILIDGKYDETQRIYRDNFGDGLTDAVGSANQVIWDCNSEEMRGIAAGDLAGIYVCPDDYSLRYITKEDAVEELSIAV